MVALARPRLVTQQCKHQPDLPAACLRLCSSDLFCSAHRSTQRLLLHPSLMAPVKRRGVRTATWHPAPEPILICPAATCCSASPSPAVWQQRVPQPLRNLELLRKGSSLRTCYLELRCCIKELTYPITLSSGVNPSLTQGESNRRKQFHCGWRTVPLSHLPCGSLRADDTEQPQPFHRSTALNRESVLPKWILEIISFSKQNKENQNLRAGFFKRLLFQYFLFLRIFWHSCRMLFIVVTHML